jgi:Flp pilus assembly protein TadD
VQNRDLDRSDQFLARATAHGLPEGNQLLIGRAIGYQRNGSVQRSLALLEGVVQLKPDDAELRMFRGRYRVELRDCAGALEDFQVVERLAPTNPAAFSSAGVAEMCLGRNAEARRSFLRSLAVDPNQPRLRQYVQQLQ